MNILTVTMNPAIDVSVATEKVEALHKMRCFGLKRDPGAGGINVARVIKRLGGDCAALYPAGGLFGQVLRKLVDAEGIPNLPIEIAAETRESFTASETASGDQYRFVLPGPALEAAEWEACLARLSSLTPPPAYVVVSGSLPPGVPDEFMARVAHASRALGSRLVVDTSGSALSVALAAGVYLVKPNLRELRDLTGKPLVSEAEWLAASVDLVESSRAQVVALTLGADGALIVSREKRVRASGIPVEVISAVGAGDSFLAAMVWRLSLGGDLEDALRYGMAAGTAALLTPGTELCRKADVERLRDQVRVDVLSKAD